MVLDYICQVGHNPRLPILVGTDAGLIRPVLKLPHLGVSEQVLSSQPSPVQIPSRGIDFDGMAEATRMRSPTVRFTS
jgi:hypothetical protein